MSWDSVVPSSWGPPLTSVSDRLGVGGGMGHGGARRVPSGSPGLGVGAPGTSSPGWRLRAAGGHSHLQGLRAELTFRRSCILGEASSFSKEPSRGPARPRAAPDTGGAWRLPRARGPSPCGALQAPPFILDFGGSRQKQEQLRPRNARPRGRGTVEEQDVGSEDETRPLQFLKAMSFPW